MPQKRYGAAATVMLCTIIVVSLLSSVDLSDFRQLVLIHILVAAAEGLISIREVVSMTADVYHLVALLARVRAQFLLCGFSARGVFGRERGTYCIYRLYN